MALAKAERARQHQSSSGAATETHVEADLFPISNGDVFDKQPDHALPFVVGNRGIVPESRKIGRQGKNQLPLPCVDFELIGLALALVILLGSGPLGKARLANR